jgi:RimJ/RimL family protein N-acetyltransferase
VSSAGSPVLETRRLVVRLWGDDEAERLLDMYSRMEVVRFLGATPTPMATLDEARRAVARGRERSAEAPWGWWAVEVRDTRVVAGTVALVRIPDDPEGRTEVAWHLHPDSWGHGFATEAAAGVIHYAHDAGLAEVLALVDAGNGASLAVARRLGMDERGESPFYGKPLQVFASVR